MLQDIITDLQAKLEDLNKQYQECSYSDLELESRRNQAKEFHVKTDQFVCLGTRDLLLTYINKLEQGYTYEDSDFSCSQDQNGIIYLVVRRPEDVLNEEYRSIEERVKADYLDNLEKSKARLLEEIARTKLSLRDAQQAASEQQRRVAEFDQLLRETKDELTGKTEDSQPQTPITRAGKAKGSTGA